MAASLLALLSQQAPNLQTRRGLIVTGLQNDFLSPEGKLPSSTTSGFLDRLRELVPAFREYGEVVWVRSHFQETREVNRRDGVGDQVIVGSTTPVERMEDVAKGYDSGSSPAPSKKARLSNEAFDRPIVDPGDLNENRKSESTSGSKPQDDDEELFLTRTANREPCCIPGSYGAEYAAQIADLVDHEKDIEVVKTYYSALNSTSLLLTLRSRLITELFVCGCTTNLSVFATAMDAARHGIKVTLVEDCLGYRKKERHDSAIRKLRDIMGADVRASSEVLERLKNPLNYSDGEEGDDISEDEDDVAVGEQADLLEADSADDEDLTPPLVRPSYVSTRSLAHRYASSTTQSSLKTTATEPTRPPSVEHTKSSSTRIADTSSAANDDRNATSIRSSEVKRHRKRENNLEQRLSGSASDEGVNDADCDSSKKVTPQLPRVDVVDSHWKRTKVVSGKSSYPGLSAISAVCGFDQSTVNHMEDMMAKSRLNKNFQDNAELNASPLFGEGKELESGGSRILFGLLPPDVAGTIFEELNQEITWQKMHHQTGEVPRLVCCQGTIGDDGSMPLYRHPSDQTLPIQSWTHAVDEVRGAAEQVVGHNLNHALIQLYRGGPDYISEHSDKTLDIMKDSFIVNVSFGAQRTMRLRTKRSVAKSPSATVEETSSSRTTFRVPMPHNSIITMSLTTNAKYLHGINADKRPVTELTEAEKAFSGQRISLTFRNIGTFLNEDSTRIWGQGATGKTKEEAKAVIIADATASERLLRAFGAENQSSRVDWDAIYGNGSDVLHLK